jgi:KaiC/GvpD/RAD55 family RecA-like ATPase
MDFSDLRKDVDDGRAGKNKGIPMGFDRLNHYIGLRKKMYFLVGGLTGSGKTSFIDDAFVLNPIEWALSKLNKKGQKLKIIYRSMERSRNYKIGKWVSRKIFLDTGRIIPLGKLLGWTGRLDDDDYALFLSYEDYVTDLLSIVEIIDGTANPIGITAHLKDYALANGNVEKVSKYESIYTPDDPSTVTIVVIDHIGLLKATKDYPTKKARIDKMSDELRHVRDFYGFTPVVVSQFNREIGNFQRIKNGDVEPQLEDFKDSSNTQDDADIVMALFDPMRYKVEDPSGYDLEQLRDAWGAKYFRSLRLIKNSYGEDDVRVGLGFLGHVGIFKELPKMRDMTDDMYKTVTDKTFFMKEGINDGSDY